MGVKVSLKSYIVWLHLNATKVMKSSEIVFIFLPAFYLIIWLMTLPKNFEKISILKIQQLVFFWGIKIYFGKFLLKWCIFRHGKIWFSQIMPFNNKLFSLNVVCIVSRWYFDPFSGPWHIQKTIFASMNQYFIDKLSLFLTKVSFDTSEENQLSYFQNSYSFKILW